MYFLISIEFRTNGYWECNVPQVHPGLSLHQTDTDNLHNTGTYVPYITYIAACMYVHTYNYLHILLYIRTYIYKTGTMDFSIEARNFSALSGTLDAAYDEATNGRAIRCSVSSLYHHRKRYPSLHTAATDKHCEYLHM